MSTFRTLCVFCGSSPGKNPAYLAGARATGVALAQQEIGLIYGGGGLGLMGASARAALEHGGRVVGIIPKPLMDREGIDLEVTELIVVRSMHERKRTMASMSDGFVALPGGFGTFEEVCEMITWTQLGIHAKPMGLLNIDGFYDPLLAQFQRAVTDGFIQEGFYRSISVAETPEDLLKKMQEATLPPPVVSLWEEES